MENSETITKAKEVILSVKGKTLSIEERKTLAIELAALMLTEAKRIETTKEKKIQTQLAKMMEDEKGKSFLIQMTDQSFRSSNPTRVINQINFLTDKYGSPKFLNPLERFGMKIVSYCGRIFPSFFTFLTKFMIREQTSQVILPGESKKLIPHIKKRREQGVRVNLNRLGEAILGEDEALKRLKIYLDDLAKPEIDYISVKISTICSQLNLLAWEDTLKILVERLTILYLAAKENKILKNGVMTSKFVNLDMEEYRDLHLTVEAFKRVLEKKEFINFSAGIVLQSYVPDSFLTQQELTVWACKRVLDGGSPIKIRIVKGANLAMEQVESSLKGWPQAPYDKKSDVDANYKRMLVYGTKKEHAKAAHLGIASHNLFDVAYGILLCSENEIAKYVSFEMLEGMADHMRRVVQDLYSDMLLYCPAATKEEFQNAVAYLVRRLDENTAPGNFLREAFSLTPGSKDWKTQAILFAASCLHAPNVSFNQRRKQNRFQAPKELDLNSPFENEPDTDFSLTENRKWAEKIIEGSSTKKIAQVPLQIGSDSVLTDKTGVKLDAEKNILYNYSLASENQIDKALEAAVLAKSKYKAMHVDERRKILSSIAHGLREKRGELILAMAIDTSKTVAEADVEISEAIDFAEYYCREIKNLNDIEEIEWSPKGVVVIASPWNFPGSIPLGGITAAFAAGNSVIFKPAEEAVYVGYLLAKICWKAGVPHDLLQFIMCEDEGPGSALIKDERVNAVVLTGATSTAKLFLKLKPGLDLMAETGGKNAMVITSLADRDLSIKELVQSAFSFAGQKCSACSLAICEAEVYDDLDFREQLKSATASLKTGSPFDLSSKVNPLIALPSPHLLHGLTTLDTGEEWLLKPKQDEKNPKLWSPGIRLHVKPNSTSHTTEYFGPVLSLMRAENLEEAIKFANGTPYGLTSGLQSLDSREQEYWLNNIEAGNLYINRGITGAVVQRQPFGGCKESSFGAGIKAGGPNYLIEFMHKKEKMLPIAQETPSEEIHALISLLPTENQEEFKKSIGSYAYFWKHYFSEKRDVSLCIGQDNFLEYRPRTNMCLRVQANDSMVDVFKVVACAMTCRMDLEISADKAIRGLDVLVESESAFIQRLATKDINRVRLLNKPNEVLKKALSDAACNVILGKALSHGRLELLNYLREVAISYDYHRYGNLGDREKDVRAPLTT